MNFFAIATVMLAASLGLGGSLMLCSPLRLEQWLRGFPRNQRWSLSLTIPAYLWAGFLLWRMPMGGLDAWKPALYLLTPAAAWLTIRFVDELLAVRALGGWLLLLPAPILAWSRMQTSAWRLVVVVVCYAMVVKGMLLVLNPYLFRKSVEWLYRDPIRLKAAGGVWLLLAVFLLALGVTVYR